MHIFTSFPNPRHLYLESESQAEAYQLNALYAQLKERGVGVARKVGAMDEDPALVINLGEAS